MSQRRRILHLRASNFLGGPEHQLLRYAEYEHEGPFEVIVGTFAGRGEGDELLEAAQRRGFSTLALDGGFSGTGLAFFRLLRFLAEQEISLVCSHGYKADILGTLACRVRGIPIAWFLRGWTAEDSKVRFYEALDRALLPLATCAVCLSQTRARQLSNDWHMASKVRVVPNVIEPPNLTEEGRVQAHRRLRERFGLAGDTRVVAAAARFSPEKGLSCLLEAAAEVSQEHPKAHFVLFGDGPLRPQLEEQARRLGLRSVVHFPGFVAELPDLLPGVDVLVNPSLSEEMPNIVLEGMAATIPVVATAVGGVAELAGDSPGLVLLPPADPAALGKAIVDVLRDPMGARGLARAGYERVREAFSPAWQRERLHALYEELIPGNVSTRQSLSSATAEVALPKDRRSNGGLSPTPVPYISIVIPVHNEGAYVGAVLEDLLRQEHPADRYEILVADGNSTDRTAEVIDRYAQRGIPRIVRLPNPAGLSSAGRNVGVQHSRGELIVFVDGHCRILSSTLLLDTVRTFQSTGADCLCRPQPLLLPGNTAFQDVVAHARASALGHGLDSTIYGMNREGFVNPMSSGGAYHRRVFDRVGLYDERFDACEDVEFNYRVFRAGLRSYLSQRLAVFYSPRTNPVGLWKQMVRYGRGRFRLMCKHPSAGPFSQLVPGALVAWLVACGFASLWSSQAAFILALTLLVYGAVVLSFSTLLGLRHGWRHFVMAPAVYLTIHLGLGAGFWAEATRFLLEPLQRLRRRPQEVSPPAVVAGTPRPPSTGAAREAFEPEMK